MPCNDLQSITDYQSKYIAYDLTRRRSSDNIERLTAAVAGAQVDMNPHQVDAALFSFASPLSKGALLADEVGLGKTIEAGLVISQEMGRKQATDPDYRASKPSKTMEPRIGGEIFPPLQNT